MNTNELLRYIKNNIKSFLNPLILKNGIAYHYTNHAQKIIEDNKFKGAEINQYLHCTQLTIPSKQANYDPGVVFAYGNIEDAKEEGFGCNIFKIHYKSAISTFHKDENDLDNYTNSIINNAEQISNKQDNLNTLLILNTEILCFELLNL